MTFRILVPIGCRSDEGLSAPVVRRLKKADWCDVSTVNLVAQNFPRSYATTEDFFELCGKPDLILITGDRVEMTAAAAAAFHNRVPICHLYAGCVNYPQTTFDDIDRHCITLWATFCLCESTDAAAIAASLRTIFLTDCGCVSFLEADTESAKCYTVGITHLDDLEIDYSLVPLGVYPGGIKPYDLLLLNRESMQDEDWSAYVYEHPVIQIGGNPDGVVPELGDIFYPNLPRPQFLGLLKNCRRFVTNSSAAIYEAPYFLTRDQIIMVGDRNRNRGRVTCVPGGSDRVVERLKEYAERRKEP